MELKERQVWVVTRQEIGAPLNSVVGVYTEEEFANLCVSKLKKEDIEHTYVFKVAATTLYELL